MEDTAEIIHQTRDSALAEVHAQFSSQREMKLIFWSPRENDLVNAKPTEGWTWASGRPIKDGSRIQLGRELVRSWSARFTKLMRSEYFLVRGFCNLDQKTQEPHPGMTGIQEANEWYRKSNWLELTGGKKPLQGERLNLPSDFHLFHRSMLTWHLIALGPKAPFLLVSPPSLTLGT